MVIPSRGERMPAAARQAARPVSSAVPGSSSGPNLRLALGALGVVFGDIGTSPLYAFRESFIGVHRLPIDPLHVMGVLSLIVWALVLVVTVKYVLITMRADNRGEGGSFALLALIRRVAPRARLLPAISVAALLATALFYGDAMITPAISILSAVEGLTLADARFDVAVIPITLIITLALFAIQHRGTDLVGLFFGPVMLAFFIAIAALGIANVADRRRPGGGQPDLCLCHDRRRSAARLPHARHGRADHHRRRSALCRHGAFRPPPDFTRL